MRHPGLDFQAALLPPMTEQCQSVGRGCHRLAAELEQEMRGRGFDVHVVYNQKQGKVVMKIASLKGLVAGNEATPKAEESNRG